VSKSTLRSLLFSTATIKADEWLRGDDDESTENQPSALAANGGAPLNAVPGYLLGNSVLVGGACEPLLLDERMSLLPSVKYGHMKLWILPLDYQRRLLGRFVRLVSRLQLPVDRDVKWLGQRYAEFSNRGRGLIGDRRPRLPSV
jgi:hypothetical protein